MSAPLRMLFFTGSLGAGGSEAHLVQLLGLLDRDRVSPELMLMQADWDYHRLPSIRRQGIPVHDLRWDGRRRGLARMFSDARRVVARIRPHILKSYGYPCDVFAPLMAFGRRRPRIITTRRTNQPYAKRRLLYRLTNPLVDCIVPNSRAAEDFAVSTEGLDRRRSRIVVNGVDLEKFRPAPCLRDGALRWGVHARLRHVKGIDLLLEAFAGAELENVELHIAGATLDAWGKTLRERFEHHRSIHFHGDVDDAAAFLHGLDRFVLPSRSEAMSMSLLESMACGLPVVATDVGGNREVLDEGRAGILVEPSVEGLREGLLRLTHDPEQAAQLGRAARLRVEQHYGLETMVRRYEQLYDELAR